MNPDRLWLRGLPPGGARVEELNFAFKNLPEGLDGARVLFAADTHLGRSFPGEAADRLIGQIENLAPDMILWGGDFAETSRLAESFFKRIGRLAPRLGMAAVVGNNDRRAFRRSVAPLERAARDAGVRLLINDWWTRQVPGGALTITGLDEDYYGKPDASILRRARGAAEFCILLSHSPAPLKGLLRDVNEPPDLILSGHTHGGQVRLLGLTPYDFLYDGVPPRGQRFFTVRGVRREGDSVLVVSGGLGSSKLPLRINCPPEMQMITLRRG